MWGWSRPSSARRPRVGSFRSAGAVSNEFERESPRSRGVAANALRAGSIAREQLLAAFSAAFCSRARQKEPPQLASVLPAAKLGFPKREPWKPRPGLYPLKHRVLVGKSVLVTETHTASTPSKSHARRSSRIWGPQKRKAPAEPPRPVFPRLRLALARVLRTNARPRRGLNHRLTPSSAAAPRKARAAAMEARHVDGGGAGRSLTQTGHEQVPQVREGVARSSCERRRLCGAGALACASAAAAAAPRRRAAVAPRRSPRPVASAWRRDSASSAARRRRLRHAPGGELPAHAGRRGRGPLDAPPSSARCAAPRRRPPRPSRPAAAPGKASVLGRRPGPFGQRWRRHRAGRRRVSPSLWRLRRRRIRLPAAERAQHRGQVRVRPVASRFIHQCGSRHNAVTPTPCLQHKSNQLA